MRVMALGFTTICLLAAAVPAPARAADDPDKDVTREEVEAKKREVREMERELRRQEQERERESRRDSDDREERRTARRRETRMWIGVGAGVGYGAVDVPCQPTTFGSDCREEGILNTYSANLTLAGRDGAIRLRGIRDADKGDDARTPYETAALIGTRFGRSDWYGLAGYGRIRHVDDRYLEDRASGFAWEILFAPSSEGHTGLELSFLGNTGEDVDFVAFNLGMRLGALR